MTRETVALTYAELAERLGIEIASAKMRARRGKWHREPGNDGRTRVQVPVEVLNDTPPPPPEASTSPPAAPPPDAAALAALREAHIAEITRMEAMHKSVLDALRELHVAEVMRIEAMKQRDREAHAAEVERIRADHAAELARLMEAHQQAMTGRRLTIERARAGFAMAARWVTEISNRARR